MTHPLTVEKLVPPQQRRQTDDDRSLGELARGQDAILQRLDGITDKLDGLSATYTPREVHDLAVGGMKIDIRRLDEERAEAERRVTGLEVEINRRYRQNVTLTISVLLAPLTVALIIYVLTQVAAR